MLNSSLKKFKKLHKQKKNQIIFSSINTNGEKEIINLIDNFLIDKNRWKEFNFCYWKDYL